MRGRGLGLALVLLAPGLASAEGITAFHWVSDSDTREAGQALLSRLQATRDLAPLGIQGARELGLDVGVLEVCAAAGDPICWVRESEPLVELGGSSDRAPTAVLFANLRRAPNGRLAVTFTLLLTPPYTRFLARANAAAKSRAFPESQGGADPHLEELVFGGLVSFEASLNDSNAEAWTRVLLDLTGALRARHLALFEKPPVQEAPLAVDPPPPAAPAEPEPMVSSSDAAEPSEPSLAPLVGGGALATVGAAILVYSLVAPRNVNLCASCASFVSFGEGASEGSGVLIAPVGYSLVLSGASWAGAALLFPEASEGAGTWISFAGALALGFLSYGLSAAAGG